MAKGPSSTSSSVVPLFSGTQAFEGVEEIEVGLPPTSAAATPLPVFASGAAPDLTGKTKVALAIGPGRSGKTTLLRWVAETMADRGSGEAIFAAVDPTNRSLAHFVQGVEQPPTNDPGEVARWLEALLSHSIGQRQSALVDLGGGDTSLARLIAEVPDLPAMMEQSDVAPVAFYTLGPREDDLAQLAGFERAGFQPAATALILNEALADPYSPRTVSFGRVLGHSAFKAAVARGARVLWMPRLEPDVAAEIEAKRLQFAQARDGKVPAGKTFAPMGPFNRSRVRRWLDEMNSRFDEIRTWLP